MKSRTFIFITLTTLLIMTASLLAPAIASQKALGDSSWVKTSGPGGGATGCIALDSEHNILYSTGNGGVWKYDGTSWTNTGGDFSGYAIKSLAYDSVHNLLYAGTFDNTGVWKYDGTTWTNTGGGVSSYEIDSLAYDSVHDLLYAGCCGFAYTDKGVWKYDGTSWTNTGGDFTSRYIYSLTYDSSHDLLYAGMISDGVWKYDGTTWTNTGGSVSSYSIYSLAYDSTKKLLYAAVTEGDTVAHGVWKYDGTNWTNTGGDISGFNIDSLAYDSVHNLLYAGTFDNTGVWKYDGTTWTNTGGEVSGSNIYSLAYDSVHNLLYAGTNNLGVCEYDGYSWAEIGEHVSYSSASSFAFDPNNALLYVGTGNGGVWKYDGTIWTYTGKSMPSYSIPSLTYDSNHDLLYAGTVSHGVWKYDGTTWVNTNGVVSSYSIDSLVYDSSNNYLYAGTSLHGVWKYDGTTWTNTGGSVSSYSIDSLVYDSSNNYLYAGTIGHGVWKYNGASWVDISGDLSNFTIPSLAYDSINGLLYASVENGGVWKYDSTSWTNTGGNFPTSINHLWNPIICNPTNNLIYVGTQDQGVWKYDGTSWTNTGGGVSSYGIPSLFYEPGHNVLYAGTDSQGVWKYNVSAPMPPPTVSSITPSSGTVGTTVHVTNLAGTNFQTGATVKLSKGGQGDINATGVTVVSSTQITCDFNLTGAAPGAWDVTITNPDSQLGTKAGAFTVTSTTPIPTITTISPTSKTAGDAAFTLTVNGTNFVAGSKVRWNGTNRTTTYVSATKLTAAIPASDIASAGSRSVTVYNPAPGGGTSNSKAFTVTQQTQPNITSVSPSSGPPGTIVTITGSNFGSSRGSGGIKATAASYVSFNGVRATVYPKWTNTQIQAVVPDGAGAGPVWVVTGAGTSNKTKTFTVASPTWYLAEGSTNYGFDAYITIENPNTSAVTAKITYMTGSGPVTAPSVTLPAKSQATVNPRDKLGANDFSTKVVCKEGKAIAVDRTMSWTGPGAASPEAHSSIGVTSPAKTWYLPEGSSKWGFECWLLIQNPNSGDATCNVTYMIEGEGPKTVTKSVPANSRKTFNMADDIGEKDASIKVASNIPVIPERAMYRNNRREGHDSIGTTSPAGDFYLAEGTSAYGFTTYVLIQNPNSEPSDVTVTYMTPTGPQPQAAFTMSPNSRKTIRVNDVLPGTDFSTKVEGTKPVIAERAMYWDNGTGEACHDSVGMASAHSSFYLPDGQTSDGRETYTLVQNPNSSAVTVEITYMTPTGAGNVVFQDTIPANSRMTYNMVDKGISGRAAIMVKSKTSGKKIMVERAMYWNNRGAGTDTIGGYAD